MKFYYWFFGLGLFGAAIGGIGPAALICIAGLAAPSLFKWWQENEERQKEAATARKLEQERQQAILAEEHRQEQLEAKLSDQKATATKKSAKTTLRNYINEMVRYCMMIPAADGNEMPLSAINDSIDNILADSNIEPNDFREPSILADKEIILEHLNEHKLSNHIVVKRLRNLFPNDAGQNARAGMR